MIILGAGMAGCLAGIVNHNSVICEPLKAIKKHKAILRFRSDEISKLTGVPFKKVNVIKSVWDDDLGETKLKLSHIVSYSQKVSGVISARSIKNVDNCTRWIAPNDFHEILIEMCGNRIKMDFDISSLLEYTSENIISTLPIHVIHETIGNKIDAKVEFNSIFATTIDIPNCDINATIYYPGSSTTAYRASIVGSRMIIESIGFMSMDNIVFIFNTFGVEIDREIVNNWIIDRNVEQKIGKMISIDDKIRKNAIVELTKKRNIYSLGRFATWRNVLLDDVLKDIYVIRALIQAGNPYDHNIDGVKK